MRLLGTKRGIARLFLLCRLLWLEEAQNIDDRASSPYPMAAAECEKRANAEVLQFPPDKVMVKMKTKSPCDPMVHQRATLRPKPIRKNRLMLAYANWEP